MEKFFERLKKYYEETPQEVLEKEWKKIFQSKNVGPDVEEYFFQLYEFILDNTSFLMQEGITEMQSSIEGENTYYLAA